MRSIEDKGCYNRGPSQEISSSSSITFEFHKSNGANRSSHHRMALGKPTTSKWDDAQKWLMGLSRGGDKNQNKPRNSNADDRRLIAPVPQKEHDYSSEEDEGEGLDGVGSMVNQCDLETKNVECNDQSIWKTHRPAQNAVAPSVRSICVRDMGTEMTPIGSQEPSRTATPIRATTPAARSPISSGSSTPVRCNQHGLQATESYQTGSAAAHNESRNVSRRNGAGTNGPNVTENVNGNNQSTQLNPLEAGALAWDEAERAKYMARYKREEVKIQAWENHQKRKAEMEMKKMEVKAERLKARAQERLANKLATTKRAAEDKRANAESKLNEQAVTTSERADYIRRTGHLPTSFSLKLPSLCW